MVKASRAEPIAGPNEEVGSKVMCPGSLSGQPQQLRTRIYSPRLSRVSRGGEYDRYFAVTFGSQANGRISPLEKCWRLAERKRPSKCLGMKEKHACFAGEQGLLGTRYKPFVNSIFLVSRRESHIITIMSVLGPKNRYSRVPLQ